MGVAMGAATALTVLCALPLLAAASTADILTATTENFEEVLGKEGYVLVKFFAPWCEHCTAMHGEFVKAAAKAKGLARFVDVDADKEEELGMRLKIQEFPTVKLFSNGEELTDYKDAWDADKMVRFIEDSQKPAYDEYSSAKELETYVEKHKDVKLVVGCNLGKEQAKDFNRGSFLLRDMYPGQYAFVAVTKPDVVSRYAKLEDGEIAIVSFDDGVEVTKYDPKIVENLARFLRQRSLPAFGKFVEEQADLYTELDVPLVIGFFDEKNVTEDSNMAILKSVAEKRRKDTRVAFAWADRKGLFSFMDHMGLTGKNIAIGALSFDYDLKYALPEDMSLTEESLDSWVGDLIAGKIKPHAKSEPAPDQQPATGPLRVVGSTWDAVVQDPTTDVLIAQVAPWCDRCRDMKPSIERAANELRAAKIYNVVIATMDASMNDAPQEYRGSDLPTIHFFPAAKGTNGTVYEGGLKCKDFIDFLKEHAVNKFEFDTSNLGEDPTPEPEEEEEGPPDEPEAGGGVGEAAEDETADKKTTDSATEDETSAAGKEEL